MGKRKEVPHQASASHEPPRKNPHGGDHLAFPESSVDRLRDAALAAELSQQGKGRRAVRARFLPGARPHFRIAKELADWNCRTQSVIYEECSSSQYRTLESVYWWRCYRHTAALARLLLQIFRQELHRELRPRAVGEWGKKFGLMATRA
jgi:hypothetical protein